jgi:hypothetical protein
MFVLSKQLSNEKMDNKFDRNTVDQRGSGTD